MKTKTFSWMNQCCTVACLMLASSFPGQSLAAPTQGLADGCEMLGHAVEQAVLNAATQGAWQARNNILAAALSTGVAVFSPAACDATTQTVTSGFHSGLQYLGIPVWWNDSAGGPIHHCLSHDLRFCYPRGNVMGSGTQADLRFVMDGWGAIRTGVLGSMPGGPASNLSTFSAYSLAESLAASLGTTMSGPLTVYHQSITVGGL